MRILDKGFKKAGFYKIRWDRRDDKGRVLSSGIYFCKLSLKGKASIIKLIALDREEAR